MAIKINPMQVGQLDDEFLNEVKNIIALVVLFITLIIIGKKQQKSLKIA